MTRLTMCLALFLTGCGAAYIAPSVEPASRNADAPVDVVVVTMTPQAISAANASPYQPRRVPRAFGQTATAPDQAGMLDMPQTPGRPEDRPAAVELRVPPEITPGPYRIGIADVLLLATTAPVTEAEALSGILAAQNRRQGYTVQDDGTIAIPNTGRVRVAGLTVEDAEAAVFQALVASEMDPTFSLEIAEFNSKRVSVGGAVGRPALVPITLQPLRLGEALQLAGGVVAPDQDYASIRLFRDGTLYQIPLTDFFTSARLQRIALTDGDAVYVDTSYELDRAQQYFADQLALVQADTAARANVLDQLETEFTIRRAQLEEERQNFVALTELDALERDYVYRAGELVRQSRLALPYGRMANLADAIYAEGGFDNARGNPSQIYLLRGFGTTGGVRAYHLDARNPGNLILATQMQLRPNDFIFIEEQPITKWNRVVSQFVPSLFNQAASLSTGL
ncbi:polysaccharide biosynthesis/export family protein [Meridianimarinicoccus roseus]|uniref:polysaccharide biosynthesis/export family protein n=1 Tax=Meridianimarinicoccus roseus TaxID=2072018 RepID=UPI001EE67191|nr:polysaccharide biosynthesis/export family protein [Meridianimarinicoccus roseus]